VAEFSSVCGAVVPGLFVNEDITLINPTSFLRDSYDSLVKEFVARGENLVPFVLAVPYEDFEGFVRTLHEYADGVGLPAGFVPRSTYWLVKAGNEIVGVSILRHKLTPKLQREGGHIGYGVRPSGRRKGFGTVLLAETLKMAKAKGLNRVLITWKGVRLGLFPFHCFNKRAILSGT